jgi:heme/copper-type cytochrome/quinol oxidase subunit 1
VPPLVRRYIKTAFVFLLAGLGLGAIILVSEFVLGRHPPRLYVTAHAHLLLVGFMLMLVMGVATWMFPRPARDDRRYRPGLAEAAYWLTAAGTALRAAAEIATGHWGTPGLRLLVAAGGLGQLAGAALFAVNMWWRVRMPIVAPPASPPSASA